MAKYFEVQRQWPELYGNFKFDTVKELLLAGVSEMMPKRDDDGVMYTVFRKNYEKIFVRKKFKFYWCYFINKHRLEKWDPNEYDVNQVYRAAVFLNEFALLE